MSAAIDVADLAAEQWGLVTTAQARELGASPQVLARLASRGALERMTHGVYRVAGAPSSPLDDIRAVWLALDPSRRASERRRDELPAVVSHRSAASLHELGDLEADELEFTSATRKQTRRPDVRIHRLPLDPGEWTLVDGLPVTTIARTIGDLAEARIDGGHLASAVRDAITKQQADDRQIAAVLRRHAHHYGAPLGNGEELLARLLQESGISEPLERAVSRATRTPPAWDAAQAAKFTQLAEQVAAMQRSAFPAAALEKIASSPALKAAADATRLTERIASSPAFKAAIDTTRFTEQIASSPAFQELARSQGAIINSTAMRNLSDLALSPAIRELAAHSAEVANLARLAREAAAGVIEIPELASPASDDRR